MQPPNTVTTPNTQVEVWMDLKTGLISIPPLSPRRLAEGQKDNQHNRKTRNLRFYMFTRLCHKEIKDFAMRVVSFHIVQVYSH